MPGLISGLAGFLARRLGPHHGRTNRAAVRGIGLGADTPPDAAELRCGRGRRRSACRMSRSDAEQLTTSAPRSDPPLRLPDPGKYRLHCTFRKLMEFGLSRFLFFLGLEATPNHNAPQWAG